MELLYNGYFESHSTIIYDNLDKTNLENIIKLNKVILRDSATVLGIGSEYDQAPDRAAYDYYGDDMLYPVILEMNNIPSLFNFNSVSLNRRIILPDINVLNKLLGED